MTVELGASDLLAYRELVAASVRGPECPEADRQVSGVRCGRPLIYPVPAADLPTALRRRAEAFGGRYVGALFAFDLDVLPPGRRYTAARFEVALADPRAVAVQLDGDGDTLGVTYGSEPASATAAYTVAAASRRPGWLRRLLNRRDAPRAWVTGAQSAQFGWVYDDPGGDLLLPRSYGMHALLELPAGAAEVGGTIGVGVQIAAGRGRSVSEMREAVPFTEPLTPAAVADGYAVRLCMAADVSGYSRRGNAETERIQTEIVELMSRARRAAGIADGAVNPQPQGDGQFTVMPVGIDESTVIPTLLRELDVALRELNQSDSPMRLRVALHRGLIKEGRNGWIGAAPIAVHRILESPPLREALREHAGADFVLGVPDVLFRDAIVHFVEPPRSDDFTPMLISMPEKDFVEHGWLHVPGRPHR